MKLFEKTGKQNFKIKRIRNFYQLLLFCAFSLLSNQMKAQLTDGIVVYLKSAGDETMYLAPKNGGTANQTLIAVHPKSAANEKACQWRLEDAGARYFYLRNVKSNKMLDLKGGEGKLGTPLWLWTANRSDSQKFIFRQFRRDPSLNLLESKVGFHLRMDLQHSVPVSGSEAVMNILTETRRVQKWRIVPANVKQKYKVTFQSFKCIKLDDPGDEIELFGKIWARGFKDDRLLGGVNLIWERTSKQLIDLKKGQSFTVNASYTFEANNADMAAGKIAFDLVIDLYEHDSTSANELFSIGDNWMLSDGFGRSKTRQFEVEGTIIEIKWRVDVL